MEVMLINPMSKLAASSRRYQKFVTPVPPSGIAYIAALLEQNNIEVAIIDQDANKINNREILEKIKMEKPQVVGFTCLTPVMGNVRILVGQIKALRENIKIVLGNIHPTLFADEILKHGVADIIVRGEGEYSMLETVLTLGREGDLRGVKGISFVQNKKIYHNPSRDPIQDLDTLPYPAWHLFNLQLYKNSPLLCVYNNPILPIQASRGCPYRCTFCAQDKIYQKPRYRKIEKVVGEIEYLYNKFNIRYFGFTDAFFPFSVEQGLEFCDLLVQRGLHEKIKWTTETRVNLVNSTLLKRMKEAGAYLIMYGFESGNQEMLDSMKKGTTIEQARKAMEYTKEAGILTLGLFILGMPGETRKTCEETIKFAKELDPDVVKFNTAVPFPGSEFFEHYRNKLGDIEPEKFTSWYDWSSNSGEIIYAPEGMAKKELVDLQRKAMFQFYVRPRVILKHLAKRTISFQYLVYGGCALVHDYFKIIKGKTGIQSV